MSRIFAIILLGCVVLLGALWYANRSKSRVVRNGEVVVHEPVGDRARDASSSDQSGQPPHQKEPATGDAGGNQEGEDVAPPTADSIRRDPPNGVTFAGKGKYQLYRQGDITWRMNTDTGDACILFATDAEWRKPKVFQQGCNSR